MGTFIIENSGNSYIMSILMALFFEPTKLDNILDKPVSNTLNIYFRECIKTIILSIRNGKSILQNDISIINMICNHLGWKSDEEHINNFYSFLIKELEIEQIELKIKNDQHDYKIETHSFIQLSFSGYDTHVNTSTLLNEWLNNSCYINNIPYLIGLSINRSSDDVHVIIQKRISSNIKDIINNIKWKFHSAICHKGNEKYYSLLSSKDKWYIFDDSDVPCLCEIKMDDPHITKKLKLECVFIIYKLPNPDFKLAT